MRREGVYSSSLSTWQRQRAAADLAALAPQKRGPKPDPARADAQHIAQLTRERDRLRVELDKAQLVIEVQEKLPRCSICRRPRFPIDLDRPGGLKSEVQHLTAGKVPGCKAGLRTNNFSLKNA